MDKFWSIGENHYFFYRKIYFSKHGAVRRFPGTNMCELYGNRCFDSMVESRYVLTGRIFKECRTKCPLDCVNVVYKSHFDRFGFRP